MIIDRYAALERATGTNVVKVGDIWWQQVRPFLYRPLLPFKKYDLKNATEGFKRIGALQHGVADGQSYDSYLNPIVFDELQNYDMKNLRYNVRKHIKKALRNDVTVSRIVDEREFSENAYPCYVSFYERTKYAFDTSRRQKDRFSRWSHALFEFPETVVLGAFAGRELVSFEISCLVEDTLVLKTLVNSAKALKLGAPDLLLHTYRISTREQPQIHAIYVGMLGQSPGINEYYFIRGARVLALPAFLHMHRALLWLVRKANKSIYGRLHGLANDELLAKSLSDEQRRSERFTVDVPLIIRGEAADRKRFQEERFTLTVNAHGALLTLGTEVSLGQKLLLMNPTNWHECQAKVVYVETPSGGLTRVGVELDRPVPEFWQLSCPPADCRQS